MFRKNFRFRRRLFVGLAFAALAAPAAAQAQTGVFIDGGPMPVSNVAVTGYQPQARSEHSYAPVAGLTAETKRFLAMAQATRYQPETAAISERSNGVKGPDPSLVPQVVLSTSNSFDWSDAGIGASTVFAAALLLGIAIFLTRRNQHSGLTSA